MLAAHRFAELFPPLPDAALDELASDIRANGLRDRIVLHEGQILDGRNRFAALAQLVATGEVLGEGWGHRAGEPLPPEALEPPQVWFETFNAPAHGDPLAWVVSKNLQRRHLDESQRAMVAAKLATMPAHRPNKSANLPTSDVSQAQAAKLLNVGERSLRSAKQVQSSGIADLQKKVEQGEIAVSTAALLAMQAPAEQAAIVAKGEKEILSAAKDIRSRQRQARFAEVNERLAKISEGSKPLPTGQRYPIIYADPATRYVSGFGDRSIENHYPTMTVEELCQLPVGDLALDDAVLFCWSTVPQLANTMRMIDAWGFTYVSQWCWDKIDHGTGHWAFNQHEPLLIATRGNFPAPVPGTQPRSLHAEKKGAHSAKPAWFAEQIERIWPDLPKIELFARTPRPDWAAWGNQANASAPDAAPGQLPSPPKIGEPMEFSVGGLRKNVMRFGIRQREPGRFDWRYDFQFTTSGSGGPFHGDFASFEAALRAAVAAARDFLIARRDATDSVTSDAERRAARAGLDWIERTCATWAVTWALDLDDESRSKAEADLAAMEGAQASAAEGMDSVASRLAAGRTADTAEGAAQDAPSAGEFEDDGPIFGEAERVIWKRLQEVLDSDDVRPHQVEDLIADGLVCLIAGQPGSVDLTSRGLSTLGMYDACFNPPPADEPASTAAAMPRVGPQSAPPHLFGDDAALLDIPAFLDRRARG